MKSFDGENFKHDSFPQPTDFNVKVWKYLSLAELLNMVLSESLHFSRLDLLEDNKNSTFRQICSNPTFAQKTFTLQNMEKESLVVYYEKIRKCMFVNCWHLNDDDSELMWKLHSKDNKGIALQTTYLKLAQSLDATPWINLGLVRYKDFEKDEFDTSNLLNIATFKDIKYTFENEVRFVISNSADWYKTKSEDLKTGETLTWKLSEHVDRIFVDPYASKWYFETVKSIIEKLGLTIPVDCSGI